MADYDMDLQYQEGRANVVADALSRKRVSLNALVSCPRLRQEIEDMGIDIVQRGSVFAYLGAMQAKPSLLEDISVAQMFDKRTQKLKKKVIEGKLLEFRIDESGMLRKGAKYLMPNKVPELKTRILQEAHNTPYSVHPGASKMYQDTRQLYCWLGMKKDIAKYVE